MAPNISQRRNRFTRTDNLLKEDACYKATKPDYWIMISPARISERPSTTCNPCKTVQNCTPPQPLSCPRTKRNSGVVNGLPKVLLGLDIWRPLNGQKDPNVHISSNTLPQVTMFSHRHSAEMMIASNQSLKKRMIHEPGKGHTVWPPKASQSLQKPPKASQSF